MNFKTPLFNAHDLIVVATALAAVLMWLMLLVGRRENRTANIALMSFFACQLVHSICVLLVWNTALAPPTQWAHQAIMAATALATTLKGPALFAYINASTDPHYRVHKQHLWHLALPIIVTVYMLFLSASGEALPNSNQRTHDLWLLMKGASAAYALAAIPIALNAQHLMQNFYSEEDIVGRNWLGILCCGYAAYWFWTLFSQIAGGTMAAHSSQDFADALGITANYIAFFLLLTIFAYNASMTQSQLNVALTVLVKSGSSKTVGTTKQRIPDENRLAELALRLKDLMKQQQPHLQSNLTAEQLANQLDVSQRELSQVLNQHYQQNFFDYVNGYRVEEAKSLLNATSDSEKSITDIIFLSGFNSKSSFQRFFKRQTGMSPSEYRQQRLNEKSQLRFRDK